jgi:hypothetical protein
MGQIPQEVRGALVKAMTLKIAMIDTERQMKER